MPLRFFMHIEKFFYGELLNIKMLAESRHKKQTMLLEMSNHKENMSHI